MKNSRFKSPLNNLATIFIAQHFKNIFARMRVSKDYSNDVRSSSRTSKGPMEGLKTIDGLKSKLFGRMTKADKRLGLQMLDCTVNNAKFATLAMKRKKQWSNFTTTTRSTLLTLIIRRLVETGGTGSLSDIASRLLIQDSGFKISL